MVKERYCSRDLCELLKDKGFDGICHSHYYRHLNTQLFDYPQNWNAFDGNINCPTHQMACDWLRGKGLYPEILTQVNKTYTYQIVTYDDADDYDVQYGEGVYNDYAECVESAIKYCLTELMKNESE